MSAPQPEAAAGPEVRLDLVIQAPDLPAQAVAAFRRRFPQSTVRRQTASIRFAGAGTAAEAAADVAALAQRWRCDATLVPPGLALARFRLLALDMDSTLIRIECIDELAALAGLGREVAAITEAAMRGEIADYADSLRRRVALLAGLEQSLLQTVQQHRMQLSPGAERLLESVQRAGLRTLLVTGGFGFFARTLQRRLAIDSVRANEVQVHNGRLTGIVHGPAGTPDALVDAEGKAQALRDACRDIGCAMSQAIAIGDGANDLPMLALAGIGVAFHAKPKVRQQSAYALDYAGLDGVLEWFS